MLSRFERTALAAARLVNDHPALKRAQFQFLKHFGVRWAWPVINNRVHVVGWEPVRDLAPDRGVLLCANHRSFFDQYAIMTKFFREPTWFRAAYFPVRSTFFYETWLGLFMNAVISGMTMYPPVFREPAKAELNKRAVALLSDALARPGVLVGMHPEGTRGKGDDPYTLLPAQPGVGQLILQAHPIVLPVWVNGLSNDVLREVKSGIFGGGEPIIMVFGKPLDLGLYYQQKPRPALYKKVADRVMDEIRRLGETEKELRAELARSA